jgi:predicted metal-dependent peptidase
MDLFGQAIDHVVNLALEEIIAEARVSHCIQEPADLAICKDHRFSRMSCHQILAILMCEHPDPVTNEQDGENGGASPDDMGGEYGPGSIGADPPGESAGEQQGSGSGQTPAPSQDGAGTDADEVRRQWKTASTMMAMMGQRAGKLPGCMKAMITELTTPRVDWRARLRDILTASHQAERSFVRYNRRDDDLPGWEREGCGGVVVVVDTSGSTWDVQKDFLSEIDSILADLRPETTYIVWADAEVHGCDEYRAGERLDLTRTQPRGGGGTSFAPAFDWVEEHHIRPEALIYLTDLEGGFPDEAPPYRVIWCVYNLYGSNLTVPFGEVIEVQPGKEK